MEPEIYLTTSWDDGHPLDLRVAEILAKHRQHGTFYVPRQAEHGTMTMARLRELSLAFEIGAHTLNHVVLTGATEQEAAREITDSKSWVEDSTGLPCPMFSPPRGKYSGLHLAMVRNAGYSGLRSVELGSLDYPRRKTGLMLMPTSVQAYPHGPLILARNAVKRAAFGNLWRYIVHGYSMDWPELTAVLLAQALRHGGVFHLWGHSWELQQASQWQRLDDVLRAMGQLASRALPATNGQICRQFLSQSNAVACRRERDERSIRQDGSYPEAGRSPRS